jgi:hypothetical protein
VPAASTATVSYGANGAFFSRQNVTGTLRCDNATFGDPISGVVKACSYQVTSTSQNAVACASEGGICTVPAGTTATVTYGANGAFYSRPNVSGMLGCDNASFGGDPIYGVVKACSYQVAAGP